jgi:hypothetical protein
MLEINLKQFTINIVIGYLISWAYFFITLPLFIILLGKFNGSIINYGLSWLLWIGVTYYLHKKNPKGNISL